MKRACSSVNRPSLCKTRPDISAELADAVFRYAPIEVILEESDIWFALIWSLFASHLRQVQGELLIDITNSIKLLVCGFGDGWRLDILSGYQLDCFSSQDSSSL